MEDWKLISSYSRAQAIDDGVLVDSAAFAKAAGFRVPVAVTARVWSRCIADPAGLRARAMEGRWLDLLVTLRHAITAARVGTRVEFTLYVRDGDAGKTPTLVQLYATCGPGDDAEPVITVMLIGED